MRLRTHLKIAEELAEFAAAGSDGAADSTCTIDPMVDEKKEENWRKKKQRHARVGRAQRPSADSKHRKS